MVTRGTGPIPTLRFWVEMGAGGSGNALGLLGVAGGVCIRYWGCVYCGEGGWYGAYADDSAWGEYLGWCFVGSLGKIFGVF